MTALRRFYSNHVLANLVFILILIVGTLSFLHMPREQDPTVNFNWIDITTVVPGMAASDVEKRVTDILEDALRSLSDVKFVSSNSRENLSSILVRFNDIDSDVFDKRVNDLRREIQAKDRELPDEAEDPIIFEITTANAFPTASIVVSSAANDENLRAQAERIKKDLERIRGVDRILEAGLVNPELRVELDPDRLEALGISPAEVANTVALYYRDLSAGSMTQGGQSWLVRMTGTSPEPADLDALPLVSRRHEVRVGDVASVVRGHDEARHLVVKDGRPAVMLSITKQASANTLDLVARLNDYVAQQNDVADLLGVRVEVADDSTAITRNALNIMETNALFGLALVLLVAWLFLGFRIAVLTAMGIPFILAGTFWALQGLGQTVNVTVLLGVVISLGMLVDDAVVIVEGMFYRLQRGMDPMDAALDALQEVIAPVTAAVLTTMAAFLPLMLLPGILGAFMKVVPMVVTVALAISLIEAYWMLPVHVVAARIDLSQPNRIQRWRARWLHKIRITYTRLLTRSLRWPKTLLGGLILLFLLSMVSVLGTSINPALQQNPVLKHFFVQKDFFASDPLRLFYINLEMPSGTPLEETIKTTLEVEQQIRPALERNDTRSIVSWSGQMFTETAPLQGSHYGQILVVLNQQTGDMRDVDQIIEAMRDGVNSVLGPTKTSFLKMAGGPPAAKEISVKVRGNELEKTRSAANALKSFLRDSGWASDITDDDTPGLQELVIRINQDQARRAGITPDVIMQNIRLLVDGNIVASMQEQGETLDVRVSGNEAPMQSVLDVLKLPIPAADGSMVPLNTLVNATTQLGFGNIRHYNFVRTITVESDIDATKIDVVTANNALKAYWAEIRQNFPGVDLDFSGQLDDLNESLGAIFQLMIFGVLMMYAILGTQFRSYLQPLMILMTVPMAFTGVVIGLLLSGNPLSLYTLYGVVALAGIAVNSAIVLISAANSRLEEGMSVLHATIYAARRRVIPILITSLTTVAGLASLALGLGGKSLLWGPVATAIVSGLLVSTILTLFTIPLLYRLFMPRSHLAKKRPSH